MEAECRRRSSTVAAVGRTSCLRSSAARWTGIVGRTAPGASQRTADSGNSSPMTDAGSITARSSRPSRSRRAASEGLDRRRAWRISPVARRRAASRPRPGGATPSSTSIETSCSTNSGLPSAAPATRARTAVGDARLRRGGPRTIAPASVGVEGAERRCARRPPSPQVGRSSSRSCRAVQASAPALPRPPSARCSSRSSSVGSAQWMSSITRTSGPRSAEDLEQPPDGPEHLRHREARRRQADRRRDALARRPASPRSTAASLARARVGRSSSPMPAAARTISTERPERDALAVGRHRPSSDVGVLLDRAPRNSRDQARLADARVAEDRRPVRRRDPSAAALERLAGAAELRPPGRRSEVEPARYPSSLAADAEQPVRGHPLRLALQLQRLDRLDLDGVADQPVGRLADQDLASSGALCSRRAAVLTVSPVTSRCPLDTSPATTSPGVHAGPVLQAHARTARASSRSRSTSALLHLERPRGPRAARRPRGGAGSPNTAMIASPMYFSTRPPCRSSTSRISLK